MIRTGHHCAQPVMEHFMISATTMVSPAFYNTKVLDWGVIFLGM